MADKERAGSPEPDLVARVADLARSKGRTGRNQASIRALQDKLQRLLDDGYTWRVIWAGLREAGQTEMSYDVFRRTCKKVGLRRPQSEAEAKAAPVAKPIAQGRARPRAKPVARERGASPTTAPRAEGFMRPNDVSRDDIY